jgi:NADPH2:quinone reductase
VFWGEFSRREPDAFAASVRRLSEAYVAGKLRPHVSATFPLERAGEALRLMAERKVIGKMVITVKG